MPIADRQRVGTDVSYSVYTLSQRAGSTVISQIARPKSKLASLLSQMTDEDHCVAYWTRTGKSGSYAPDHVKNYLLYVLIVSWQNIIAMSSKKKLNVLCVWWAEHHNQDTAIRVFNTHQGSNDTY